MKKRLLALMFSAAVLSSVLVGCANADIKKSYDQEAENTESMFVEVEKTSLWKIVYDKKTKVMYAVSYSNDFTLLVDENGNPKLWDGE